ncbi:MAG: hypothetical protein ABIJ09_25750 [Pseudomonadota bacterium]
MGKKKNRKASPSPSAGSGKAARSGGGLMAMRRGIKGAVGVKDKDKGKPRTVFSRVVDIVFWVLTVAVVGFVLYSRFARR